MDLLRTFSRRTINCISPPLLVSRAMENGRKQPPPVRIPVALGKLPPTEQNVYLGADFDFVYHWIIENELIDEKESLSLVSLGEREQVLS